jgi:hypothetical protein
MGAFNEPFPKRIIGTESPAAHSSENLEPAINAFAAVTGRMKFGKYLVRFIQLWAVGFLAFNLHATTPTAGMSDAGESCVQPSPEEMARAAGVVLPRQPWHVANIWWDFEKPIEHFTSLQIEVTIDRDIPATYNLYISPCGIAKINDLSFYGGLQSNINGWRNATNQERVFPGHGAIFSRWSSDKKTPVGLENVRVARSDCLVESAGYEGEFASVRRPFAWTKGTYTYAIEKRGTEIADGRTNTWFACTVKSPDGSVREIGSLRFEGGDFVFWARHSAFVEVYSTERIPHSDIPKVNITFGWPMVNGEKVPLKKVTAYYPHKADEPAAPDCAWIKADGENVRVEIGAIFRRDEALRRHELKSERWKVASEAAGSVPAAP